jgi:hypothetical protein
MINKKFWLGVLVVVLTFEMMVVGCNNDPTDDDGGNMNNKEIAPRLIGKWETQSITVGGTKYNLPYPDDPVGINSAGYEFTSTTYKCFVDGTVFEQYSGMYTDGIMLYLSIGNSQIDTGMTWQVSDNKLTLTRIQGIAATIVCQKVTKFSWEP